MTDCEKQNKHNNLKATKGFLYGSHDNSFNKFKNILKIKQLLKNIINLM